MELALRGVVVEGLLIPHVFVITENRMELDSGMKIVTRVQGLELESQVVQEV